MPSWPRNPAEPAVDPNVINFTQQLVQQLAREQQLRREAETKRDRNLVSANKARSELAAAGTAWSKRHAKRSSGRSERSSGGSKRFSGGSKRSSGSSIFGRRGGKEVHVDRTRTWTETGYVNLSPFVSPDDE